MCVSVGSYDPRYHGEIHFLCRTWLSDGPSIMVYYMGETTSITHRVRITSIPFKNVIKIKLRSLCLY